MDPKKFAFICCVNDWEEYEESCRHIGALAIPDGYTVERIPMEGQPSMTAGYNRAMQETDAKYKIYHHQDTMVIDQLFLFHVLYVFNHPSIGMIGVAGSEHIPESGIWWEAPAAALYGMTVQYRETMSVLTFTNPTDTYVPVASIDGLIMVTQHDLLWVEQFDGWHFYDVSQSVQFARAGYQVVVPHQTMPWTFHNCGTGFDALAYDHYLRLFLNWYSRHPDEIKRVENNPKT
ncbi:glycosyltransferase family protein [Geomicrobium sp. JCM 19039]|uniref:glycosyltransferase family protein n=1 Tax=Geomicrobium sp. JCM 19039 TaxID=1460636 RepID=UPI00045F40C2|nr:glycosyltransferase family protein [Geomicrobium sp. JCM 19039]GAK11557.1 streptomycin biosynthesis StrF domain protein [Geomicrobium sp. JCM 19039]